MVALYKVAIAAAIGIIAFVALYAFFGLGGIIQRIKVSYVDLGDIEFKGTQLYLTVYIHFDNPANIPIEISELKYDIYFENIKVVSIDRKDIKLERGVNVLKTSFKVDLTDPKYKPIVKAITRVHKLNYKIDWYVKFSGGLLGEYSKSGSEVGVVNVGYRF